MKHFMIKYQFKSGTKEEWHRDIAAFISALDTDPALKGRISDLRPENSSKIG